jgi:hypothetical protein
MVKKLFRQDILSSCQGLGVLLDPSHPDRV